MSSKTRMATSAMISALALNSLISACQTAMSASFPRGTAHAQANAETPAVHGMLVVGANTLYVSHLPMFHAPHNAQAIAAVQMTDAAGDVRARLARDRARTGETVYTLVPEPDRLTRLFTNGQSYPATLYRGHFERGGTPLLADLRVTVQRVVHGRTFTPRAGTGMQPQWLLFGTPQEPFAAHRISAPPDLDQVVALQAAAVDPAVLARGETATITAPLPLQAGAALTATVAGRSWPVRVTAAIYAETGDLAH
jgi:hypothetical protein